MLTWLARAEDGALGPAGVAADRTALFERGDRARHVYLLAAGAVEIRQRSEDGASPVVKILVAPALFGQIEALAGELEYLESVRSLGRATFHRMRRERFLELAQRDALLGYESLTDLARAFCVKARFETPQLFNTESLLANVFIAYAELFGARRRRGLVIGLRRTQADLADAIGAGERSVNRILALWKQRGVITKASARYVVLDEAFLREAAGDLLGSLVHRTAV